MDKLSCIIINEFPNIEDFEDKEEYYDGYWQLVSNYPLIMLPKNRIIFWGFEVVIAKNEYDLLKAIIDLNTNSPCEYGYTEEQLIENVDYRQRNSKIDKKEAYQRFITTSMSRIKTKITKAVVEACFNRIDVNKYNPFIIGKDSDRRNFTAIDSLRKDKTFTSNIMSANLNLIKIFPYLLNFVSMYDKYYSSFVLKKAFTSLICSAKGQKQLALHRHYKTDFIFSTQKFCRNYTQRARLRIKDENFSYAKTTPTKYNLYNFVNYPQYSV